MKKCAFFLATLIFITVAPSLFAQGTAFSYQGQLANGGSPANGYYDFTFALYNNSTTNAGQQVGATLTLLDVEVSNGLFAVTLDFGQVFTGNPVWLALGVRTNGASAFTPLNPLQELTPAPYSIYAAAAGSAATAGSAHNLTGTLSGAQLAPGALAPEAAISGASVSAAPNTSYLATNASQTTVNLPATANLGDIVQVHGVGAGGWQVLGNVVGSSAGELSVVAT